MTTRIPRPRARGPLSTLAAPAGVAPLATGLLAPADAPLVTRGFSPSQVPGAVLWARAEAGYVANTGGLVDSWTDRVAPTQNGIGTTTTRPTFTASDSKYGGRGSITSAAKYLVFGVAADWAFFHLTGGTIGIVFTAVGNGNYLLTTQLTAGTEVGFEILVNAAGTVRLIVGNGTQIVADISTTNFASQNVPNVLVARFDPVGANKIILDLNGVRTTLGQSAMSLSSSAPSSGLAIGAAANGAAPIATLDYAELFVSTAVVSDAVADQFLAYAQSEYGAVPSNFFADFTTQPVGAGSLAGYGLTFNRSTSGYSVQTGTSTTVTTGLGVDVPRFGRANDAWNVALVHEEQRTNQVKDSRDPTTANWQAGSGVTTTRPTGTGPDGDATAPTRHQVPSAGFSRNSQFSLAASQYAHSLWVKQGSAGANNDQSTAGVNAGITSAIGGTAPAAWSRRLFPPQNNTALANVTLVPEDGRDESATGGNIGGIAAGARDGITDLHQIEAGKFATEAIITAGATATRNADMVLLSQFQRRITRGRIAMELRFRPKMSSANHVNDSYLLWINSTSSYFRINGGTCSAVATVSSVAYVSAVAMAWSQFDLIELWIAAGGGVACEMKYRVNGGATVLLSTGSPSTVPNAGGINDAYVLGQGAQTGNLNAWVEAVNLYANGARPAWT